MAQLTNKTQNKTLLPSLEVATSFRSRAQGLIGKKRINKDWGMWFPNSNWIHTLFMSVPIDVVYLDKQLRVKKLQRNLQPWRFPAPVFAAKSVVESYAGFIDDQKIQLGDTLNVGN